MSEQWRWVHGYEGIYQVSDLGRVRSMHRGMVYMMKCGLAPNGYPRVPLSRDGVRRLVGVHQLVAAAFIGPRPEGMEVCHNDGDRANNRASNLRYDTRAGNLADCIAHGTATRGERNRTSLTEADVVEMRQRAADGESQADLATAFGISRNAVCNIVRGNRWAHAGGPITKLRNESAR